MLKINVTWMIGAVTMLALVTATQLPMITITNAQNATTSGGETTVTTLTAQKTEMSTVDSLPGHQGHQAVVVLSERTDGKIWVGKISWSASKPVEVRLLHNYDTAVKPDLDHGKPITAPVGKGEAAISLLLASNGAATVPSYYSGSVDFASNAVAFHTLGGIPFTVTYTVDAVAKDLTK